MGRKKAQTDGMEHPDYDKLVTVDDVEKEIETHKERLVGKDFLERRIKEERKDLNSMYNEQLKEVSEEREHEMGILGALEDRKKQILAKILVPLPVRTQASGE